ncbi:MAG: hypothetical protein AAF368_09185, partial [Planctomycetota bacterium]
VAVMGTIELAFGGVNVLTEVFSGNIEDAAERLKQLPAGIGPVATQLETMLGNLTGMRQETELLVRLNESMERTLSLQAESASRRFSIEQELAQIQRRQRQEAALAAEDDPERRARMQFEFALEGNVGNIEREIEASRQRLRDRVFGDDLGRREREEREARRTRIEDELRNLQPAVDQLQSVGLRPDRNSDYVRLRRELNEIQQQEEAARNLIELERERIKALEEALAAEKKLNDEKRSAAEREDRRRLEQQVEQFEGGGAVSVTGGSGADSVEQATEALQAALAKAEALAEQGADDLAERMRVSAEQRFADRVAQIEEQALAEAEAERMRVETIAKARAERMRQLDDEIAVVGLRLAGQDAEADRRVIESRYEREIAVAETAEEAKRLQIRKTQELQRIEARETARAQSEAAREAEASAREAEQRLRDFERMAERSAREAEQAQGRLDRLEGGAVDSRFARFSDGSSVRQDKQTVEDQQVKEALDGLGRLFTPLVDGFLGGTLGVPSVLVSGGA